jgi:hypothetical protein
VVLKPKYQKFFFDPRYRLPLHQTVFHDSVIATHHWSAASLKFTDQVQTNELLELLYNVPPMYHLNRAEWKKPASASWRITGRSRPYIARRRCCR